MHSKHSTLGNFCYADDFSIKIYIEIGLKQGSRILLLLSLICSYIITIQAQNISFTKTILQGTNLVEPTSLQFGPDNRLYVSEKGGTIYAYTVNKVSSNYIVVATETINLVKNIPNHNDDGSFSSFNERQITGLLVVGTAQNPVLYVSSSDPRIGGGGGSDTFLDTNSGTVSRLTHNGINWEKVDIIRGLPRSEENHATNGMQYVEASNTLFIAQGGNTNAGAPSENFDLLCEYALSTAILEVDLDAIEAMPLLTDGNGQQYIYDLPTLDDPTRPNVNGKDINDPFGGNDGLNQAKYIPGGPISIYSTGYRNQYDLVITEAGNMYTWDNGANAGIGGHPENEGTANVTNNWVPGEPGSNTPGPNDDKVNNKDGLHKVTQGYYAGHPNPIRANPTGAGLFTHEDGPGENGTFRTAITGDLATTLPVDWPPYPAALADVREADFQNPGVDDGSIYISNSSTNGITEYTASSFNGAMQGDLLAVSFAGDVLRVDLDANGDIGPEGAISIANQLSLPLDVTTLPNNSLFAGTIWVAEFSGNSITILEPSNNATCLGSDDDTIDEDGDGYTNGDEIDNESDPCNPAIVPADFDQTLIGGFKVSNLNDPDDDDDGLLDTSDPFAQDPFNGLNTTIPYFNPFANGTGGLLDLGFTGLMTDGNTDYLNLIANENDIIAGGAPELLVIPAVEDGDAIGSTNTQVNAFQFGINVNSTTPSFTVSGEINPPFFTSPAQDNQALGIFIGNGDQDNYLKIVLNANGGSGGIQMVQEVNGIPTFQQFSIGGILNASSIKLSLSINPAAGTVQPLAAISGGNPIPLGSGPINTSGAILNAIQNPNVGMAVGIIATSAGPGQPFTAVWDGISLLFNDPNALLGQWTTINNGANCAPFGSSGSCPQGRHQHGYVEVGENFYLLGGRENDSNVNSYDPLVDSWTVGATPPILLHHFQGVRYKGLIYVMGAFTNNFPSEVPVPSIYIYDPAMDTWTQGPEIPVNRRRGAAAAVLYKEKIYLVGGIQNGHIDGRVAWLDEYDPSTNSWTVLPDAPHVRDHCSAIVWEDKLYMAGGKKTNLNGNQMATEPIVDVYDFATQTWQSLPNPIPTPRGGNAVAVLGNELLVIGGESIISTSLNKTEALNLETNTWRTLPNLNQNRHATQAIVNNGVVYVAAGSPVIGDGNSNTQEVFYFTQQNQPVLTPLVPGLLSPEGDNLDENNTLQFLSNSESIQLFNTNGNQGIIIETIAFETGSSPAFSFFIENNIPLPYVLAPGDSLTITINVSGNPSTVNGVLAITHSGANAPITNIILNSPLCLEDNDSDGICATEDCNDNDPNLPALPGTPCNDGNPSTTNDIIQADGCTCQGEGGSIADCNGVVFTGGNGTITLSNLIAESEIIEIIGEGTNWQVIEICNGDCNNPEVIQGLSPGIYTVKLNVFGSDGSYCYRQEDITVTEDPCTDIDGDGVCFDVDCDDTDPSVPTTPGTACDDGDPNTENDVIQADGCTCQGTGPCSQDIDGDGVCSDVDCNDTDPSVPTTPGTACDDGDPDTENDVIQADGCTCQGTSIGSGGPANCPSVEFIGGNGQITLTNLTASDEKIEIIGAATGWIPIIICDIGIPCSDPTIIPNLAPGDYSVKLQMFGNDGTYCYREEIVQVLDGSCTDSDGDGVCVPEDCDDTDPSIPTTPGTACDDGDPNTENDVIQADGCTCQGTGPCTDNDNDGVCVPEDCDDNDPFLPTLPGASCDDGDPNTENDVYQADGCTCQGTSIGSGGPANCPSVEFIGGNGQITLTNLTASDEKIEIIGAATGWIPIIICDIGIPCSDPTIIPNLAPGDYSVKLQMFGNDGTYCYREEIVQVLDGSCTDTDGDGVCVPEDCDDTDPSVPTTPGTACDDGDPNTENDVIQADGCTCAGSSSGSVNCGDVQFIGGAGEITLSNLTAPNEVIQILGEQTAWETITICENDCANPHIINNLSAGIYTVKLQMSDINGNYCFRQEDVTVTSALINTVASERTIFSFTAYPTQEAVLIKWANNTGYKNDQFVIERSKDGIHFEAISTHNAAGIDNSLKTYKELDDSPLEGNNYYRLKLIYNNGSMVFTRPQKVVFRGLADFSIYPNPAQTEIFVELNQYIDKKVDLIINNQFGKELYRQHLPKVKTPQARINLGNFNNGLYILQINTPGKETLAKKLVISKLY